MALHLHIGVKPLQLDRVVRALFAEDFSIQLNGDGWNLWGDRVGSSGNDDSTMHGIITVKDVETARKVISILPETTVNKDGDQYVLTEEDIWTTVVPLDLELIELAPPVREALERLYDAAIQDATNEFWITETREAFVLLLRTLASVRR